MLITEVSKLTGLTKKAINYYEKQGLIKPSKNPNRYREYTDEDIEILQEISLYRKLDISIRDIKLLINSKDKRDVLRRIIRKKREEENRIAIQKAYLRELINKEPSYETIRELNREISTSKNKRTYLVAA